MSDTPKRVTLQDIADECNVSLSTVSRALNNSVLVSDEIRESVLATAARLGYQKRTIRKHSTRAILNIMLFLPDSQSPYINLFYDISGFVKGVYAGFGKVKANIIVRLNHINEDTFQSKKLGDIDGCIFAFTMPKQHIGQDFLDRKIPVFLVNRYHEYFDSVIYNTEHEMQVLVEQVIKKRTARGAEPIKLCYVGFTSVAYINRERREAIEVACKHFDIPFNVEADVFEFEALQDIPTNFLLDLKASGYNTVIGFNDVVALYLYQIGMKTGISFPEDFSLTGHDASPALDLIGQRIDSMDFNFFQLGQEAARGLKKRIIGRSKQLYQIKLDGLYIEGDSI